MEEILLWGTLGWLVGAGSAVWFGWSRLRARSELCRRWISGKAYCTCELCGYPEKKKGR